MSKAAWDVALAFGGAALAATVLTPITIRVARAMGVVDLPNARKIHQSPVPRCGGVAIALAVILACVPLLLSTAHTYGSEQGTHIAALLGTGIFVLVIGLLDDLFGVPSTWKLVGLVVAALVFCGSAGRINSIFVRHEVLFQLGWMSWPITMLWIVGVTVGINFIDGLDGLAAGIAGIAATVLGIGSLLTDQFSIAIVSFAIAGSLAAFLLFNFHPARIFMGDCGSMFLGFMIAASGVLCSARQGATTPGILLPGMALIIPMFDTLFTLIRRRVLQRRSIFAAERGHIHHRLLDMGLRHPHAVLLLYGVSLVSGVTGLLLRFANVWLGISAIVITAAMVVMLFRTSGSSRARDTVLAIRRNRAIAREWRRYRQAFEDAQLRFRNVVGFESWWHEVCAAAEMLGFVSVTLPLNNRDGSPRVQRWHHPDSAAPAAEIARATLPVRQRRAGGPVQAEVEVDAYASLESAGYRIALFSRLMGEHSLATLPAVCVQTEIGGANEVTEETIVEVGTAKLRVAIVHDFLYTYAGAERVLEQIINVFPEADLFALFDFLPPGGRGFIRNKPVKTSFIQKMPLARKKHRAYLPLMPLAIEQLDVSNYDLVISSSHLVAKGVITRPNQLHVCYCYTPVRFAWVMQEEYLHQGKIGRGLKSIIARSILHYIRNWDVRSANGVDVFVTISRFVSQRVEKIYRRRSTVIYPPVNTNRFTAHGQKEDFYLTASRLVPYKRIDLIIEAFNRLPDKKLIVVGDGPEMERLQALAGPNVRLLGQQSGERLRRYLQLARGFIFAAEEDFGIAPVEAHACGTPVLAFGRGGAVESVVAGKTGLFFNDQNPQTLIDALKEFEAIAWDPAVIRAQAEKFSERRFRDEFRSFIENEWAKFTTNQNARPDAMPMAETLIERVQTAQFGADTL